MSFFLNHIFFITHKHFQPKIFINKYFTHIQKKISRHITFKMNQYFTGEILLLIFINLIKKYVKCDGNFLMIQSHNIKLIKIHFNLMKFNKILRATFGLCFYL